MTPTTPAETIRQRPPFAAMMRYARRQSGRTQLEVAALLDVSESYVCLLESGKKPPPRAASIARWARYIGIDPAVAIHASGKPVEVTGDLETIRRALALGSRT